EAERIAHVVGDLLNGLDLVVVGEDDGVAFALEGEDFLLDGRERRRGVAGRENERFVVEIGGHGGCEKQRGAVADVNQRRERSNVSMSWKSWLLRSGSRSGSLAIHSWSS